MNSTSLHLILQQQKTYRNKIKKLTQSKNCYSITITARQSLKSEITMVEFFFFFNPFFFPPMQINRRDLQLENMRILTNVSECPLEKKHHFCCKSNSRYQPASNSPYITKLSIQKKNQVPQKEIFYKLLRTFSSFSLSRKHLNHSKRQKHISRTRLRESEVLKVYICKGQKKLGA